ncbi:MAG TPA: hypothetical protein VHY48_09575 [Acidobacteriaceae bacterium]|jgi:hypothetical protein|nr:hypothetical protein [Acidobacteriaceae bacterium]
MTRSPRLCLVAILLLCSAPFARLHAQASAIPSAQTIDPNDPTAARKLLDQMIAALGGPAWLNRIDFSATGQSATFYKSNPNPYVTVFEQYLRFQPFGERRIIVSKQGVFIPTTKRDVAEIWTTDSGYEVTYKGKKQLPQKDIDEFFRNRRHSLETVVHDWLPQPGVLINYEGTELVGRRLADKVGILTTSNDGAELSLDESTHLPLSLSFQYRDPVYHDIDTDVLQYDDYHPIEGIMTPLTLTRLHNGDMVAQIFLKDVHYNKHFPPDLFDPNRPLKKSAKK